MQCSSRSRQVLCSVIVTLSIVACGRGKNEGSAAGNVAPPPTTQPTTPGQPGASYGTPTVAVDTAPYKHHSKLKGAAAGAVVGHIVGHPAAGAAAGAIYQHERNKHKK